SFLILAVTRLSLSPLPSTLPPVLAGPILRRLDSRRLVLWLVASSALTLDLLLEAEGAAPQRIPLSSGHCRIVQLGKHAFIHFLDVQLSTALPQDTLVHYDLLASI